MGIPYYFKNCIDQFNDIYIPYTNFNINIDNLFLDLNCAIHPCAKDETDEDIIIQKVLNKIDVLVKLTNLKKLLFIAIDGVAPKAKMIQQKQRRFSNYNNLWDTNAISPGTSFMNKLNNAITNIKYDFNIIISNSDIPGEGEHKIFNYIHHNSTNDINVVYGLDADLIMLSLIQNSNIYLLREKTEFNIEKIDEEFLYFNINSLKEQIFQKISSLSDYKLDKNTVIYDYIFLCFLLGNDFIQPLISLNIRYNGINKLINYYIQLQNDFFGKFYIINLQSYNIIHNLQLLFNKISYHENNDILTIINKKDKQLINNNIDNIITDRSDEKIIFKDISNWELKYYNFFFNNSHIILPNTKNMLNNDISDISYNYVKALHWISNYYFKRKVCWRWCYHYHFSPSSKDIYNITLKTFDFIFKEDNPYSTNHQLIQILPKKSFHLLNDNIVNKLRQFDYMYPTNFKRNTILKKYYWEGHGFLPLFTDNELTYIV